MLQRGGRPRVHHRRLDGVLLLRVAHDEVVLGRRGGPGVAAAVGDGDLGGGVGAVGAGRGDCSRRRRRGGGQGGGDALRGQGPAAAVGGGPVLARRRRRADRRRRRGALVRRGRGRRGAGVVD